MLREGVPVMSEYVFRYEVRDGLLWIWADWIPPMRPSPRPLLTTPVAATGGQR